MSRRLVLCDFDRTLNDTERLLANLLMVLRDNFGIDPERFRAEIKDWTNGELYDLFAHLASHGLKQALIRSRLRKLLKGRDFLFPDAVPFIRTVREQGSRFIIPTVGDPGYQGFKISLAPALTGTPVIYLTYNKGKWLEEEWLEHGGISHGGNVYDDVVLIDDKDTTFTRVTPRAGLQLYRIRRPGDKYASRPTPDHVHEIASLMDVGD